MRFSHLFSILLFGAINLFHNGGFAQEASTEDSTVVSAAQDTSVVSEDDAYALAVTDFNDGRFEAAAEKFQLLVNRGLISKDLYFNLGTTLEKLNQPGQTVLWMRRAQLIDSMMVEPRQNLVFLKRKLGFLEFGDDGATAILRRLPPTLGDWIAMIALWLVAICFAMAFILPRFQERRFRPLFFGCLAAVVAFGAAWYSSYYTRNVAIENFATVTANGATALTSPVPDAKPVIDLPPGSEVRILQITGPWTYVDIPGEIRGWLRNEQLAAVWPIAISQ